jgi:type VI secretion system protein ImpA
MATAATVDIGSLLMPVSESAPAGVDLRADVSPASIYFRLKDARSGARAAERRADSEGGTTGLLPEWQTILVLAPKSLAENSKDLEIVVWYIEALVRAHGFAGLRDGLHLARGLIEQYWDKFFSLVDEDGMVTRLAPLAGLNGQGNEGTLIQPLRMVSVTTARDEGLLAVYHYDQARALANIADAAQRARREAAGEVTMERFMAAVNESGGDFYVSLLADIDGGLEELSLLGTALHDRAGRDAPSTSDIAKVLTAIRDTVATFSADLVARALAAAAQRTDAATAGAGAGTGPAAAATAGGPVRNREDALRVLQQVAEYFRKNEPHSPIAMSLDDMVRRAKMPFAEMLAELLPDTSAWRSVLTSAGIKPPVP